MFLTDFRTRKYTGGIISRVGIFLTVTPVTEKTTAEKFWKQFRKIWLFRLHQRQRLAIFKTQRTAQFPEIPVTVISNF